MLTGPDLLTKVKELGDTSKSDLVRECGYVSTKKDGTERLNFTAFYEALLEAKGMSLGGGGSRTGKARGRSLSYITRVQFNGNLMIGKAYTAQLGLKPGDEFEIKLGRKQIRLIPASGVEYEAGDPAVDGEDLHDLEELPTTTNELTDSEPFEEDSADTWMEEAPSMAEPMETEEDDLQMAV